MKEHNLIKMYGLVCFYCAVIRTAQKYSRYASLLLTEHMLIFQFCKPKSDKVREDDLQKVKKLEYDVSESSENTDSQ